MYFRTITIEYLDYGRLSPDFFEYTESTFEQAVAHFRENFCGRIINVVCREHLPDYISSEKETTYPNCSLGLLICIIDHLCNTTYSNSYVFQDNPD